MILPLLLAAADAPIAGERCEDGWRITGYYTPVEGDWPGPARMIAVEGVGQVDAAGPFLDQVITEGWGRTRAGWYLGRWRDAWHKAAQPLDAHEQPLATGKVALDRAVPPGTRLRLPLAPAPWNTRELVAQDVGSAVGPRHVDVYTGEGRAAEAATYAITTDTGRVCLAPAPLP